MEGNKSERKIAKAFQRWCVRNHVMPSSANFISSLTVTLENFRRDSSLNSCDGFIKRRKGYRR